MPLRKIKEGATGTYYSDAPEGRQGSTVFIPHKNDVGDIDEIDAKVAKYDYSTEISNERLKTMQDVMAQLQELDKPSTHNEFMKVWRDTRKVLNFIK